MSVEDTLLTIGLFERDLSVQAGAGTGKTHALVTLYLHWLMGLTDARHAATPAEVAVITFTDKAAAELKDRIRRRIVSAIESIDSEPTLLEAAKRLGLPRPDVALLARSLDTLSTAPIGTFHGLGGALLRRYALAADVDPDARQLNASEAREIADECAKREILERLEAGDAAVEDLIAQFGFLGGERVDKLVEHVTQLRARVAEEGQSARTFIDDEAPVRARDRLARAEIDWRAALAALGARRDDFGEKTRLLVDELLSVSPKDALGARGAALSGLRAPTKKPELVALKEALKRAREDLLSAQASLVAAPLGRALLELTEATERRYRAEKRRLAVIDFSDLLVLPRDLLRDHEAARSEMQARFTALLVDEFQDTNRVQAELVRLLAGDGTSARSFIVGDRKQSIYEFRGADVAVFSRFQRAIAERGGQKAVLSTSRRSTPELIRFTNALFSQAMVRQSEADWDLSFDPIDDALSPLADRASGPRPRLLEVQARADAQETRRAEARAIASQISNLRAEGRAFSEMVLLLRRFTALETYLSALRAAEVPYFVVRGRGFFETEEVQDLAAAFTVIDDPDDRAALITLLRSPIVALSDDALALLAATDRLSTSTLLSSEFSGEDLSPDDARRVARFAALFGPLRRDADRLGASRVAARVIERSDLDAVLLGLTDGVQRVANLTRLVEHLAALEDSGEDLRAIVRWLRRAALFGAQGDVAQAQVFDERADAVRVMTVHQSKGLEFPIVFVPGCADMDRPDGRAIVYDSERGLGLRVSLPEVTGAAVPSAEYEALQAISKARARAESTRLFYVAATRAKDLVIFSGTASRPHLTGVWRRHLDAFVADPERAPLLDVIDGDTLELFPHAPASRTPEAPSPEALRALADRLRPPRLTVGAIGSAVTQLADFELCARRYYQFHVLQLDEHPGPSRAASSDANLSDGVGEDSAPLVALDSLRRGTLAHALLERVDFARGDADLDELLAQQGFSPSDPELAELRGHVARFVTSPFARTLSSATLRRELPFLLAVPLPSGGVLHLRGQIDLLVLSAEHGVTVLDYKHARRGAPEDYALQLEAYALAAHHLYPSAPEIRAGLVFLKESDATPSLRVITDVAAIETRLGALGERLALSRMQRRFPGILRPECERLRCGYIGRCYPAVTGASVSRPPK